jgi:predicted neuraminidase
MTTPSVPPTNPVELWQIHATVCRDRKRGLICSTCSELYAAALRAAVADAVLRGVA